MKHLVVLLLVSWAEFATAQTDTRAAQFISGLDSIRTQLKIPGMAAAVKEGDKILLEQGLGYADLEKQIPATAQTVFRVASVTKTFTSTIAMQLVAEGKLSLDEPVSKYGVTDLGNPAITIKQLLTHTSEGTPGSNFQYSGWRFGHLTPVLDQASGVPYYRLITERILIPLKMTSSAPTPSLDQYYQYIRQYPSAKRQFDTAFAHLARPYAYENGKPVRAEYAQEFGAFGGLATTVGDLLKYSDAIDQHRFLSPAAQEKVFTPNRTNKGELTPYGIGWFVQHYEGNVFYWHYGQTSPGESALFIKAPELHLTMAVLCNTDGMSTPFPLGDGDLFMSPVGQLFYRCFVLNGRQPKQDLQNKVLIDGATMALLNSDSVKAKDLYAIYAKRNVTTNNPVPTGPAIAELRNVSTDKNLSQPFQLAQPTRVRVYGVGEDCSGDGSSWCDYGWIEDSTGKVIWQMQGQRNAPAGGAAKNQKVDESIDLPAGNYVLRYKSDWGHGYNHWDSLPPDHFFWGIILLNAAK
jgi:CubicO group peptidase (beta-lactamase class C family)